MVSLRRVRGAWPKIPGREDGRDTERIARDIENEPILGRLLIPQGIYFNFESTSQQRIAHQQNQKAKTTRMYSYQQHNYGLSIYPPRTKAHKTRRSHTALLRPCLLSLLAASRKSTYLREHTLLRRSSLPMSAYRRVSEAEKRRKSCHFGSMLFPPW
jgi:hypothetical protein